MPSSSSRASQVAEKAREGPEKEGEEYRAEPSYGLSDLNKNNADGPGVG
jgi:hypothetical protein